ncbi:MAG: ZIP family metal transporter [Candidatus Micrarchaeota archaeon]|nr:ZIP family metal transporter [Candidatus Micrarchaeota archaeon]
MVLLEIIAATVFVSLLSLVGLALFFLKKKQLDKALFYMISFAAGTMLGAAFFDILPETVQGIGAQAALEFAFLGIVTAFAMEKIIHWHHHHHVDHQHEHKHPLGMLTLVGDAFHNFFDGVAIAAAFLLNAPLGIATTIAVACHEIPHELGDFSLLLYSGYEKKEALAFNLLSALTAVAGGLLFFFFSGAFANFESYALAFAAGNFIYIASADLMPELHKEKRTKESTLQLLLLLAGAAAIWLVARMMGG